jgi:hypothetical protein
MICNELRFFRRRGPAGFALLLAGALAVCLGPASAQQTQAPPQPQQPPPAVENQPGYITQFGTWLNRPVTTDTATEAAKNAANAAIDATTSMMRLPGTRVITGRSRCDVAPNGAPDCQKAATALCVSKGFKLGSSVDYQSEQQCPASAWVSGRTPAEGECKVVYVVTRAVCQ